MAEIKFEDALKQLEKIVKELEKGDLPLEDSLKKYEEGVRLSQQLSKKLEQAQRRVEVLMKAEGGRLDTAPFEDEEGDGGDDSSRS